MGFLCCTLKWLWLITIFTYDNEATTSIEKVLLQPEGAGLSELRGLVETLLEFSMSKDMNQKEEETVYVLVSSPVALC